MDHSIGTSLRCGQGIATQVVKAWRNLCQCERSAIVQNLQDQSPYLVLQPMLIFVRLSQMATFNVRSLSLRIQVGIFNSSAGTTITSIGFKSPFLSWTWSSLSVSVSPPLTTCRRT